jgi:hypothetical protein
MDRIVGLVLVQAPHPHLLKLGQVDARQRRVSGYNAVVGIQRQAGIDEKVAGA